AYSQKTFDREPSKLLTSVEKLASANVSYALVLGGDEIVDHPLPAEQIRSARSLVVLETKDFEEKDRQTLEKARSPKSFVDIDQAIQGVPRAVRVTSESLVRTFPRAKLGAAAIHLLNWDYDVAADRSRTARNIELTLDLQALGVPG